MDCDCECFAVPVNDREGGYECPEAVRFEVGERDVASYRRAADFLNISNVDVVCLQHEFGTFGGPAGSHVLELLRELKMPVVTTLHAVLHTPTSDQRRGEREGYVPNVVYSCGSLLRGRRLLIPYAMSDFATTFATVSLDEVLEGMA